MRETIDMKVTISAVATPELYRTMIAVTNPRERAALLKRLADDCLKGVAVQTPNRLAPLEASPSSGHQPFREKGDLPLPVIAMHEGSTGFPKAMQSIPERTAVDDDEHYNFLETNLTGFG